MNHVAIDRLPQDNSVYDLDTASSTVQSLRWLNRNTHETALRFALANIGLPQDCTREEAYERIKHFMELARRIGDDDAAARLSELKVRCRKSLKHKCADCWTLCGASSDRCRRCAGVLSMCGKSVYRTYDTETKLTRIVESFVRRINRPFFLDEVLYSVHEAKPNMPAKKVHRVVYDALRHMCLSGVLSGGGKTNWRRYDLMESI